MANAIRLTGAQKKKLRDPKYVLALKAVNRKNQAARK